MAHPELIADGTVSSAGPNVMGQSGPKKTEAPWLKYVNDFNAMVPDLPSQSLVSEDARKMDKPALESVRVALIDDGVNFLSPEMADFQNRYVPGRSFDTSPDGPAPAFHSLSGHGTFMARLILHVCPYAKIIPYRLMETADADGSMPRPEPGSAVKVCRLAFHINQENRVKLTLCMAQAIKEAINEGVDIISMSWTIKRGASDGPSGHSQVDETFKSLKDVMKSSPTGLPLMFCAASDDGLASSSFEEYPSAIDRDVFRIGAAHETGQTWPNVTNANAVHFLFPGVDFALEDQPQLTALRASSNDKHPSSSETRSSRRTGSSVATALAAGLAALLIHCTKLGAYHTVEKKNVSDGNSISPKSIESSKLSHLIPHQCRRSCSRQKNTCLPQMVLVKTFHTMKSVLQRLSSQNVTGVHFANPAGQFEAATRALRDSVDQNGPIRLPGDVSRLGPIAKLARNLIPS